MLPEHWVEKGYLGYTKQRKRRKKRKRNRECSSKKRRLAGYQENEIKMDLMRSKRTQETEENRKGKKKIRKGLAGC